jgi:hypothetical protein
MWGYVGPRSGLVWSGLVWSGVVWCGVVWSGVVWSGLVWSGLVWSGLVKLNRSAVKTDNWISCLWLRTTVYQNRGSVGARIGFQKTLDGEPMAPFVDDDHVTRIVHVVLFEVGVSFRRLSDNECAEYPIGKLNAWKITSQVRSYSSAAVYLNYSFCWVITQRGLVKHRRFGTTYRSHLQGSKVFLDTWPFNYIRRICRMHFTLKVRTDMTKLTVAFCNFVNAPKNCWMWKWQNWNAVQRYRKTTHFLLATGHEMDAANASVAEYVQDMHVG